MTTPTIARTDVNAAFAAERASQVARVEWLKSEAGAAEFIAEQTARFEARVVAGELVALGGGRYQSTQGWDRGEIWTVQSVNGESLVLPQHGLDIDAKTGRARLYSAAEPWHGLGQVIPGGITDVGDVIRLAGLDFPVYRIPASPYDVPGVGKVTPAGVFHVGNGETGEYWGTTGKVHRNVPVATSFEFMTAVVGSEPGQLTWESAGSMNGGRNVFISAEVPAGVTIDADGIADHIRMFLVVQDTRDGNGSYKAMLTPWRPVCQNTNRFALRDAASVIRLRHTTNLAGRIAEARRVLGLTVAYAGDFAAEETQLARTATTFAQVEALMAEFSLQLAGKELSGRMFGARDRAAEGNRTSGSNDRREEQFTANWQREAARSGATLYAAEQAYTELLDWGGVRKGTDAASRWNARITASLAGDDDDKKSAMHAKLLQRVS